MLKPLAILALILAQANSLSSITAPSPNKNITFDAYQYIINLTIWKQAGQKPTQHLGKYSFKAANQTYFQGCQFKTVFLDKDKITSGGQVVRIWVDLPACSDLYGLKNQKVYRASYSNFTKNFNTIKEILFDAQVSFTAADYTTGYYHNLVIKSVDPTFPGFMIKQSIQGPFGGFYEFFDRLSIAILYVFTFNIFNIMASTSHFSIDFCYKASKLFVALAVTHISGQIYSAFNASVFVWLYAIRFQIGPMMSCMRCNCDFDLKKLFGLIKKYFMPLLITIGLSYLITLFPDQTPFICFLPSIMWVIDKKTSKSAQAYRSFVIEEVTFAVLMFITFYLPSTLTGSFINLVIGYDYLEIGFFCFVGFILMPPLLYFGSLKTSHKIPIQVKDYKLEGLVVHGGLKKNPRAVLKGLADRTVIGASLFGLKEIRQEQKRKLAFYRPYLTLGSLELYVKPEERQTKKFCKGTEFIDFFNYQKNKVSWFEVQKSSKERNLKATYRFQVCNPSVIKLNRYGIKLGEVEMGEALNQNKLVAIYYSVKQIIFQPRFRKVIKRCSLQGLNKNQYLQDPRGQRFSIKAFISGGKIYTILAERNNLNVMSLGSQSGGRGSREIPFSNRFRVAFLEDKKPRLDLQELPSSRYCSEHAGMTIHCVKGFQGLVLIIYKLVDDHTAILYQLEEVEDEVAPENQIPDPFGVGVHIQRDRDSENSRVTKTTLKQVCELDRRGFEDRVLHDAFFIRKDLIGLVTNKDIIICRLFGLDDGDKVENGFWSVKVGGFNTSHSYRRVNFNRSRGELHCISGMEGGLFVINRTVVSSLVIDLKPLLSDLGRFDQYGLMVTKKGSIMLTTDSNRLSELQESLYLKETETSIEEENELNL